MIQVKEEEGEAKKGREERRKPRRRGGEQDQFDFPRFKTLVENFFKRKLITLYSDNGGEYIGLSTFLATHGISHHTSPPHTLEHNGFSEHCHRHIVETSLALLSRACLPL